MSIVRRFLVAPSLVRLIRKERGGGRITEGHFAPQGNRNSYVRVDGQTCQLVLVNAGIEERTDVPRAHGDALLDVCPGKAAYDRTTLTVAGREVAVDRYVTPGSLDLISLTFDSEADASAFPPPAWFGREVSAEPAYGRPTLAIQGVPAAEDVPLSNAALDAVLDLIEPRFGFGRYGSTARAAEPDETRRAQVQPVAQPPVMVAPPPPEPAAQAVPEPEPVHQPEAVEEAPAGPQAASPAESVHGDARIDDVIESLSQALGAAIQQQPEPAAEPKKAEDSASAFERWTVRPRRTQQQS